MWRMEFNVLPGPSLPERARTALARAATATVSEAAGSPGDPAGDPAMAGSVPVCAARDGSPLLLPPAGSPLARWLAGRPDAVRVSLPAVAPFSALRLTGAVTPATPADVTDDSEVSGVTAWLVTPGSVEFSGGGKPRVAVEEYRAARPDPLWPVAAGILHHLEHGHVNELVRCVRAHGVARAEWVVPHGLDRYGLELLVLASEGIATVRLPFPGGPVGSLDDVPVSLRAALTCHCQGGHGDGHRQGHARGHERGRWHG
jgi:hypothetical protein